jgi:hypothetical protein
VREWSVSHNHGSYRPAVRASPSRPQRPPQPPRGRRQSLQCALRLPGRAPQLRSRSKVTLRSCPPRVSNRTPRAGTRIDHKLGARAEPPPSEWRAGCSAIETRTRCVQHFMATSNHTQPILDSFC